MRSMKGPETWESELRYGEPEFIEIEGRWVLLPVEASCHQNITILRTIWSADGNSLTLFLKDTTFDDDMFVSGYMAVCARPKARRTSISRRIVPRIDLSLEKSREAKLSLENRSYLLSATPMQIDTIEVFDLLQLLGLRGHWSYGKNFCNYFSTWHLNYQGCIYPMTFYPDIFDENASLQLMSFGNPLFEEMLKDLAPLAKLSLIEHSRADCLACFTSLRCFELC